MKFPIASSHRVLNRGCAPQAFLVEMVTHIKSLPDRHFAPDNENDIFAKAKKELGPYPDMLTRRAVICECMRVLALFESSCDWEEGVDTSKGVANTKENAEAGAWQVSYDSRKLHPELAGMLVSAKILDGVQFQIKMKSDRKLAVQYAAVLMAHNAMHNGPLYKRASKTDAGERRVIRKSLQGAEHSIYPWLQKAAVAEFKLALT